MSRQTDFFLSMTGITKTYPNGVIANDDVDFFVEEGEIHGLLGENGAGKTTLMKVLYGLENQDDGDIFLNGEKQYFQSPKDAINAGIGMVHQHFRLASAFSVAENVVLGQEPSAGLTFNRSEAINRTQELAEKYDLDIKAESTVDDLSIGKQQFVEILRLLYQGAEVLIMDEPTAVLTPQETTELLTSMKNLAEEGHTIIFITHKIQEALDTAEVITVMRDGKIVTGRRGTQLDEKQVSKLMVGREVSLDIEKPSAPRSEPVLQVDNLCARSEEEVPVLKDISFSLHSGEILGIAGVQGNGQTELVEVLAGLRKYTEGTIAFDDSTLTSLTPGKVRELGTSYIPEDRMATGVAGDATVMENLSLFYSGQPEFQRAGLLNKSKLTAKSQQLIDQFDIRVSETDSVVNSLSGGNIQKLILARELAQNPKLLLAAQPTRGLDVKTIKFVWRHLMEMRLKGCAILLVSSDLPEVMTLSDRIAVLYEGKIVAMLDHPEEVSEEEIGLYMLGSKQQNQSE